MFAIVLRTCCKWRLLEREARGGRQSGNMRAAYAMDGDRLNGLTAGVWRVFPGRATTSDKRRCVAEIAIEVLTKNMRGCYRKGMEGEAEEGRGRGERRRTSANV